MRKTLVVLAILAAMPITGASAADMALKAAPVPYAAAYNWTGLYVGGQAGWGWATEQTTNVTATTSDPAGFVDNAEKLNGGLAGLYAGYNYQINQVLVGIDGDFSWTDLTGKSTEVAPLDGHILTHHPQMDWVSTVTGRLGYASNNWLFFAKGGWAWAKFSGVTDNNLATAAGTLVGIATNSEIRDGWTVGGGVEYGFAAHWSAKLEYDYVNFATANFNSATTSLTTGVVTFPSKSTTSSLNIFKGGVAYRF